MISIWCCRWEAAARVDFRASCAAPVSRIRPIPYKSQWGKEVWREWAGERTPVKSGFAASWAMTPPSPGGAAGGGEDSPVAGGCGGVGGNRLFIGTVARGSPAAGWK